VACRGSTEMSRWRGACPCAWRRMPLWARGRDRARAQLTRECDTATMGAPRRGVTQPPVCAPPRWGAHTPSVPRPRSVRPRAGAGVLPSLSFESGPVHSRRLIGSRRVAVVGAASTPDRAACPLWAGRTPPRGVRPSTLGAPSPATTSHPSKPLVVHSRRRGRRAAVGNQERPPPPPCLQGQGGGSVATASDRHVVRIDPRCCPRRSVRSSGRGASCGTPGIPLRGLPSRRE